MLLTIKNKVVQRMLLIVKEKKYIKASVSKQISGSLHNNLYHQINYKRVDGYRKLKERESARFLTIC